MILKFVILLCLNVINTQIVPLTQLVLLHRKSVYLPVLIFKHNRMTTIATVLFTSGTWVSSFPLALSEPEGLNRRVIYVGGPCKAHDRLLLADL